jgi:hypothetical protein
MQKSAQDVMHMLFYDDFEMTDHPTNFVCYFLDLTAFMNEDYDIVNATCKAVNLCGEALLRQEKDNEDLEAQAKLLATCNNLLGRICQVVRSIPFHQTNESAPILYFLQHSAAEHIYSQEEVMDLQYRCLCKAQQSGNVIMQLAILELLAELLRVSSVNQQLFLVGGDTGFLYAVAHVLEQKTLQPIVTHDQDVAYTKNHTHGGPASQDTWQDVEHLQLAALQIMMHLVRFQSSFVDGRKKLWDQFSNTATSRSRLLQMLYCCIDPAGDIFVTVPVARAGSQLLAEFCTLDEIAEQVDEMITDVEICNLLARHYDKLIHENVLRFLCLLIDAKAEVSTAGRGQHGSMAELSLRKNKTFRAWLQSHGASSVDLYAASSLVDEIKLLLDDWTGQLPSTSQESGVQAVEKQ